MEPTADSFSDDTLLGGRVLLRQPRDGYRAAIDPVLLAAAVPVEEGQVVLDVGCGHGAVALCVAARMPQCRVYGLEMQPAAAALARHNVQANGMGGRVDVITGSLMNPPPRLAPGTYHHVVTNPPFLTADRADAPPNPAKAAANVESEADLASWIKFSLNMLRPKGTLTLIHRADRLEALLAALQGRAGEIRLFPLWPKVGRPAKRILLHARKGVSTPLEILPGMVLHEESGAYTPEADAVLRMGAVLPF